MFDLVNLINMCLVAFHLGFILFWTLWVSWTWVAISFPILGKCSTIISSSIFSWPFVLPSSSGMLMIRLLGRLPLSQSSLRLSLFLLILLSSLIHFYHSIFYLTNPIFYLHYFTVVPSRQFFISFIALFIIY